ncbi:MFS transporter [Ruegeria arenilitoris]|uniref:MFS transporter n=1 Tax=Ruegeria arenilitoris TaxID=1173585 RepID=UPI00147F3E08|nr:MFS transporter [Ruegeria arenilitoris]
MNTKTDAPSARMQLFYGAGGVANGILTNGLSFFLLIYYNLVIGLPAETVGLALSIALIFDAISDPLVGYLSDNTRSRAGKRHPFIYLAIIPIALLYWFIWNPPETLTTENQQFWFLLITTILLRTAMTLFDVPHNAMVPELTKDYGGRTTLSGLKVSIGWIAGQIMVIAMYVIWLVPTDTMPYGILNQAGYQQAGFVGAVIIALAIAFSALGTRRWQDRMIDISHDATYSASGFFKQSIAAFKLPALRAIFISSAIYAVGAGIGAALWTYLTSFFWELNNDQISLILIANLIGALIGGVTIGLISRSGDKKASAIILSILSAVVGAAPYLLREIGFFPANGTELLIWLLFAHGILQIVLIVWTTALLTSMTADVVELGMSQNGFQNEGIITSVITFVLKAGTAGGLAASGVFLAFVGFPEAPDQSNLTAEVTRALGWNYACLTLVVYMASVIALMFYRLDKSQFDELLALQK